MRIQIVIFLFLVFGSAQATILDPPEFRCAQVAANGDVTIQWLQPPDPTNEFSSYEIWYSTTLAGPYINIASIGAYGQLNYMHAGANANSGQVFYYIETVSTSPVPNTSAPSDSLGTIYMEVNQSTPLGSAIITWTEPSIPVLASANAEYDLFLEYPLGTWTLLDQIATGTTTYEYVISICDDTLNFRVELGDASGCTNISNVAGDWFSDQTPPSSPVITAVTVDTANGLSNINWTPSPEADTDGYIIVQIVNGNAVVLDTVWGANSDQYVFAGSNAVNESEFFTIAAFDTCWSGTPPSPNTSATLPEHNTIHLSTQLDRCNSEITLNWNEYNNWPSGVSSYQLKVSKDNSPYALIATLPSGATSFIHVGLDRYSTYCYLIDAVEDLGPNNSLSNLACRTVDYPPLPQTNYLSVATVQADGVPLIMDLIDPTAEVKNYKVLRSDNGGPYNIIGTIPSQPGPYISFEDLQAETDERSYEYKIMVIDSCSNESITSNKGTTMLLRAEGDLNGYNHLYWNGYAQWAGVVNSYNIYRQTENDISYVLIASVPADQWNYSDDVSSMYNTNGRSCYYVEAVEAGNPLGINEVSSSNVACAIQDAAFYVPNAFIAGGYNPIFQPVFSYTDVSNYEFIIYNRWGQEFFKTNSPSEAWDGTLNGSILPEGVYVYYVNYQNGEGRTFTRRGTVTFLHAIEE